MLSMKLKGGGGAVPQPDFFDDLWCYFTPIDPNSYRYPTTGSSTDQTRLYNVAPSTNSPRWGNALNSITGTGTFPTFNSTHKTLYFTNQKGFAGGVSYSAGGSATYLDDFDQITNGSLVMIVNTENEQQVNDGAFQFLTGGTDNSSEPYIGRFNTGTSPTYENHSAVSVSSLRMNKSNITQLTGVVNNGKWNMVEFRGVDFSGWANGLSTVDIGINNYTQSSNFYKFNGYFFALMIFNTALTDAQHDELYDYMDYYIGKNTPESLGSNLNFPQAPVYSSSTGLAANTVTRIPIVRTYVSINASDLEEDYRILNLSFTTGYPGSSSFTLGHRLWLGVRHSGDVSYRHDMAIGRVEILNGSTIIDSFDPQHNLDRINIVFPLASWQTNPSYQSVVDNQYTDNGTLYNMYWNVMNGTGSSGTGASTGLPSSYTGSSPTNNLPSSGTVAAPSGGNTEYWGFESSNISSSMTFDNGEIGYFRWNLSDSTGGVTIPDGTTLTIRIAYNFVTNNDIDLDYTFMAYWQQFNYIP